MKCLAFYLNSDVKLLPWTTTIGLLIIFTFLVIYFLLDQFVYEREFRPIWTPYLFIATAFNHLPLRPLSPTEMNLVMSNFNFSFIWILFGITIMMIFIRIGRQLHITWRAMKTKKRIHTNVEQENLEAKTYKDLLF